MTKALISLPSLSLIAALALNDYSLSVGGGSSSQTQGQQTQANQAGSDSAGSAGNAQGSASASASGAAASAGQTVTGYESRQIPPIPMISPPDLNLLTQSTDAFTPDLTRSITFQLGITVRPTRCDASEPLVSDSAVLGGDGSMITSSRTALVTNNDDGSGTYNDGKVSIIVNGDGSGAHSDGEVSVTINGDGPGTYNDDYLSTIVNGDDSGTYSNSTTGESITLDDKGSDTYSRSRVSITSGGDGSGACSGGKLSITNNGNGITIVNDSTISAKPVPKTGKVGTFPSINAAKPVQPCGTVVTLENSVLFDFGSSELHGEASTTFTNLATVVKDSKTPKIQVRGHTDSVSDSAFNQKLSEQRVQAVSSALKSGGVAADLEAVGYGETEPMAPNENPDGSDNSAGRRLNRRVKIFAPAF